MKKDVKIIPSLQVGDGKEKPRFSFTWWVDLKKGFSAFLKINF
jgi:hypothetical protein